MMLESAESKVPKLIIRGIICTVKTDKILHFLQILGQLGSSNCDNITTRMRSFYNACLLTTDEDRDITLNDADAV